MPEAHNAWVSLYINPYVWFLIISFWHLIAQIVFDFNIVIDMASFTLPGKEMQEYLKC